MSLLKQIFAEVFGDRVVQLGTGTSGLSFFGAAQVSATPPPWVGHLTTYIGLYAAIIGALTATATFVYTLIKIRRLLKGAAK